MLKVYLFLYTNLQEISLNLFLFKIKIPHQSFLKWMSQWTLPSHAKTALSLPTDYFWLFSHLSKMHTKEEYRDNPWTYLSTLKRKLCSDHLDERQLETKLKRLEKAGVVESMLNPQRRTCYRLTEHGKKVQAAFKYIHWKYPEMLS